MNLTDFPNLLRGWADELEDMIETNKKVAVLERELACAQLKISELKIAQMDCTAKNSELEQRVTELESFTIEPEARTTETITITEVTTNDQVNSQESSSDSYQRTLVQRDSNSSELRADQDTQDRAPAESECGDAAPLGFLPNQDTGASVGSNRRKNLERRIAERHQGAEAAAAEFEDGLREFEEGLDDSLRNFVVSVGRRFDEYLAGTRDDGVTVEVSATELPTSAGAVTKNQPVLRGTTTSVSTVDDTGADQRPAKPSGSGKPKRVTVKPKRKAKRRKKGFGK